MKKTTERMKEALVSPVLTIEIVDTPIPTPGPKEVLIKVICAGCNPKDWKYPAFSKVTANSGDDIAGEVAEVGEGVVEFRRGDRVAAFHQMRTRGGAFAEYAIAPTATTFHLPKHTSFEEVSLLSLLDICNENKG
jgi:NADPH2:quinone reductase